MHLNNLIKSSDEYNQTYLVVGKCYVHFVLERFIFQPVVTVRLASLRHSLKSSVLQPLKNYCMVLIMVMGRVD